MFFFKGLINIALKGKEYCEMLRILRKHASSWMLKGILVFVAVTFISWGGYSFIRGKRHDYVAKVNGITIGWREYNDILQNAIKQYRDIFGSSLTDRMVEELKLKNRLLDELISKILIVQEASRLGIKVSDEEVRNSIESIGVFQINGKFDQRMYERFLRVNRMTEEEFEKIQRENLLLAKIGNMIRSNSSRVSEEELFDAYLFENERLNLQFIRVVPKAFEPSANVNEIELKDYFQKHQEEFRIPPQIKVQYLIFKPEDFEKKVSVLEEEIKNFYEKNKERFKIPKRIRLREIFIKVSPDDPPAKLEEKRKKAEEVLEQAKKFKDFSTLARKYSESETAPRGGDIGWIEKGMLGEPFENILFSLKAGDLSGVLKEKNGFYIFKVEEVMNEKQRSFEEVKNQISQFIKREKAKKEASQRAEEAFYFLFRKPDLEKFSLENNIPLKTTDFLKEGDEIPEIGRHPSFYSVAFSLKVGEISTVQDISSNFYIIKMLEKRDSQIPSFEHVKDELRKKITKIKAKDKARKVSEDILKLVLEGKDIKDIAKEKGYSLEETGFFTRSQGVIPKIGPIGDSMRLIASLTEKNPVSNEPVETKDGFFIVKLLAYEPPDKSKFQSVRKELESRLTAQKQEEYFQNWLNLLRSKAKIEISKEFL